MFERERRESVTAFTDLAVSSVQIGPSRRLSSHCGRSSAAANSEVPAAFAGRGA